METVIENGMTNAIVVHENPSTVKKMWDGIVNLKVKTNQLFIKGTPVICVVAAVFAPEAAIPLLALAGFFETKTGKKLLSGMMKSEEIAGEVWKGDVGSANEKINEELDNLLQEDLNVQQVIKDIGTLK